MIITDKKPTIELSSQMHSKSFGIGDAGMIFDILRNKLYSNPISAICREVSCNARDAHREVGKPDLPIQINLPTALDPNFKVKDWGPGISPDRIENVFINYGASTKRDDNTQTGGFGIGAKVPFSYTDTFTIVTTVDGTKYNYACVIDESKAGKLMLLSKEPTKEKNGTEIIVPVKEKDRHTFGAEFIAATQYWDVLPIIKGNTQIYSKIEKIFNGKGWFMERGHRNDTIKVLIDGVAYKVNAASALLDEQDMQRLNSYNNPINKELRFLQGLAAQLVLQFNIGDLSISANRENLYLDDRTKKRIKDQLNIVQKEVRDSIEKELDSCPTLWDAECKLLTDITHTFCNVRSLTDLKWKNVKLMAYDNNRLPCKIIKFNKDKQNVNKDGSPKLWRDVAYSIDYVKNTKILVRDFDETKDDLIKVDTVKHLFVDNPTITTMQIICPTATFSEKELEKTTNFAHWDTAKLSTLAKPPKDPKKYTGIKFILYKFAEEGRFLQVSQASSEEDKNRKIICKAVKSYGEGVIGVQLGTQTIKLYDFHYIQKLFPKISFYAAENTVEEERLQKLSFTEKFEDFIKKELMPRLNKNACIHEQLMNKMSNRSSYGFLSLFAKNFASAIEDKNSKALQLYHLCRKMKTYSSQSEEAKIAYLYRTFRDDDKISSTDISDYLKNNPQFDLSTLEEKFFKTYPILNAVKECDYPDSYKKSMIDYINLIDKKHKETKNEKNS